MTASAIVVRGATTALTRRTTCRKNFLGPWHPMVEACWLYALADAQRHTDVAVHHSVLNLSHHHTNATPSQANFPEFTRRFHRDLSCSLNTLLAAERYDAPRELFDDRQAHCMRLLDAEAQASHLVYERVNPVAAGLVAHPDHMPMRSLDFGLWKRGYIEVKRPPIYFGKDRPETLELRLTPPPLLYRAFGGDLDALISTSPSSPTRPSARCARPPSASRSAHERCEGCTRGRSRERCARRVDSWCRRSASARGG